MKTSTYTCSCGRTKGEANRWLLGWIGHLIVDQFCCLMPWSDAMADADHVQHFCSEQCAYKWLASELERMGR